MELLLGGCTNRTLSARAHGRKAAESCTVTGGTVSVDLSGESMSS